VKNAPQPLVAPRTIGPGTVELTGSIEAVDIVFAPNTTITGSGDLILNAHRSIRWGDNVVFDGKGADSIDGAAVDKNDYVGWCMSKEMGNWEQNWSAASPPKGKRGGDATAAKPGRNTTVRAKAHLFDGANVRITFHAGGGRAGRGGEGGRGASFSLAEHGADCDHGVGFVEHKDGLAGDRGSDSSNAENGHVLFASVAAVPLSRVVIDGGTLIWLVRP
jgi:hypothetical protein